LLGQIKESKGEGAHEAGEETIFSEILEKFNEIGAIFQHEIHWGAALIGIVSIAVLVGWGKVNALKNSLVPPALVVVVLGVILQLVLGNLGEALAISVEKLV
ncbi:MAG: sulfate transporter, partial [Pirellulaceae bacterium]|nr:sulfate transporter [Pirellulaceae bacterium]